MSDRPSRSGLLEAIENGELQTLDGVISPQTKELITRFGGRGVDMDYWWVVTPQAWSCPACGRHKREIVRLNANGDLMCRLVEHHDHVKDVLKKRFEEISTSQPSVVADKAAERFAERMAPMLSAYDNAIICDDCNAADPKAKNMVGADARFSYSPAEIRQFVRPRANLSHEIDAMVARQCWEDARETFHLRLKVIDEMAELAATNNHWFQQVPIEYQPRQIQRIANFVLSLYPGEFNTDALCGTRRKRPSPPGRWRDKLRKRMKPSVPAPSEIEHVARVSFSHIWERIPNDWRCPGCRRAKTEVIRKSSHGAWSLVIADRWSYEPRARDQMVRKTICGDCNWVAENLAREASALAAIEIETLARYVALSEITRVIRPVAHTRHSVDAEAADMVVDEIAARLRAHDDETYRNAQV